MDIKARSEGVKRIARELGFSFCGISKAAFLENEAPRLEAWLKNSQHGTMSWMERNFDKRLDPRLLVEGAKSVISVLLNYFPDKKNRQPEGVPKISSYAWGQDYHTVIKEKLKSFLGRLRDEGEVNGRVFVDSAPVMDKVWAAKSGLGWIGKNTNLINKESGSFYFIAELITDLDLEPDGPVKDHCGDCTACLDACPTDALVKPYEIDATRCISYLTIELKENIPASFSGKMEGWIFGCDICQDICPWNTFAKKHGENGFQPINGINKMNAAEWEEMTEEVFNTKFRDTALSRPGWKGIKRNLTFLQEDEKNKFD